MILGSVMEIKNNDPKEPGKKWLIIVAIAMLLAWLANLGWGIWAMDNDRTKGGQWGDIFGAVNALFSGAAFLMIFRGYEMQRYEVKLAKRELEESKQQTKDQKAALDKQNEATERQMFENTFFNIMQQIDRNRNNLRYDVYVFDLQKDDELTKQSCIGFNAIEKIYLKIESIFDQYKIWKSEGTPKQFEENIHRLNDDLLGEVFTNGTVNSHFQMIYQLFNLIISNRPILNNDNSIQNVEFYLALAKSQLVQYEELIFLIFACGTKDKDMYYKRFLQTIRDNNFDFGEQSEYFYYYFVIKANE